MFCLCYLQIQEYEDDEPSSLLAEFCNSSNPAPVTTHFPAAYLLFHTDSFGAGKGFKVTYTLLDGMFWKYLFISTILSEQYGHATGICGCTVDAHW